MKLVIAICCGAAVPARQAFYFRGEAYCQQCGPAIVEQDWRAWNQIAGGGGVLNTDPDQK